jgi:hypothetical protein
MRYTKRLQADKLLRCAQTAGAAPPRLTKQVTTWARLFNGVLHEFNQPRHMILFNLFPLNIVIIP